MLRNDSAIARLAVITARLGGMKNAEMLDFMPFACDNVQNDDNEKIATDQDIIAMFRPKLTRKPKKGAL